MDEIEHRLNRVSVELARAYDSGKGGPWVPIVQDLYAAVRLLAARPAPAGGPMDAWIKWLEANPDVRRGYGDAAQSIFMRAFRAGWDAPRAADAARGEKPDAEV